MAGSVDTANNFFALDSLASEAFRQASNESPLS
jgi:hypothetical protein